MEGGSGRRTAGESGSDRPVLRVATYNVLAGGGARWRHIGQVVSAMDPDVVAFQEIEDPAPLLALAERLGYRPLFGKAPRFRHQGLLTRLPVLRWRNRRDPRAHPRNSLEVTVRLPEGSRWSEMRLHTVHLTAAFQRRGRAEPERMRELAVVREQAAFEPRGPHLVLGDFNSVAPGERIRAADFLGQMSEWRRAGVLEEYGVLGPGPALAGVRRPRSRPAEISEVARAGVPRLPWLVHPLIDLLPRGDATDLLVGAIMPRDAVRSMVQAGYTDCLRRVHPRGDHFTCPTYRPAVRIDYLFANPELAPALLACDVFGRTGPLAEEARLASDHFPVLAQFDLGQGQGGASPDGDGSSPPGGTHP